MPKKSTESMKTTLIDETAVSPESSVFSSREKIDALFANIKKAYEETIAQEANNTELVTKFDEFVKKYEDYMGAMDRVQSNELFAVNSNSTEQVQLPQILRASYHQGDREKKRFDAILNFTMHAFIEDQMAQQTKFFIETIEAQHLSSLMLKKCKQYDVYRMLYTLPVIGGYSFHKDKNGDETLYGIYVMKKASMEMVFAAISVAAFSLMKYFEVENKIANAFSVALMSASMVYMSGLLYGIMNDVLGAHANLPYFLLGHQSSQYSFFMSNDPWVQGIGWGVLATQDLAKIAAVLFAILTLAVSLADRPVATCMLSFMAMAVPLVTVVVDVYAQYTAKKYFEKFNCSLAHYTNVYQTDGLALMSPSKKARANWLANSDRNSAGYIGAPLIAIISLVLMFALPKSVHGALSIKIQCLIALSEVAALAGAITYARVNQDKQIDNRYKILPVSLFGKNKNGKAVMPHQLDAPKLS